MNIANPSNIQNNLQSEIPAQNNKNVTDSSRNHGLAEEQDSQNSQNSSKTVRRKVSIMGNNHIKIEQNKIQELKKTTGLEKIALKGSLMARKKRNNGVIQLLKAMKKD